MIQARLGVLTLPMGILACIAVAAIVHMRLVVEHHVGKAGARQASAGGMQAEDVLYLLPLVTFAGKLVPLPAPSSVSATLFALWVLMEYLALDRNSIK